jgi:hypothetical protein
MAAIDTLQKAQQDIIELQQQIASIESNISGLNERLRSLTDKRQAIKNAINKLPPGKLKIKAEIEKISNIDVFVTLANRTLEDNELNLKLKTKIITEEEYNSTVTNLSKKRFDEDALVSKRLEDLQQQLIDLDKAQKQKEVEKKQNKKTLNLKLKLTKEQKQAQISQLKSIAKSGALIAIPIITSILTKKLSDVASSLNIFDEKIIKLNEEIDKVNADPNRTGLEIVIAQKNALLNEINNLENIIKSIQDIIKSFNTYASIFNLAITVANLALGLLPQPVAGTPGYQRIVKTYNDIILKATNIIQAISVILPIASSLLDTLISALEDIKSRIKDIENRIDNNLPESTTITQPNVLFGSLPETYEGFKFAIREENTLGAPKINGIGRHYGVAIDSNNVEVLKTDLSFTQNTEVLIDQLKFIIDSQNLRA